MGCKSVKQQGVLTWLGMIGYNLKNVMEDYFLCAQHVHRKENVGVDKYAKYGIVALMSCVTLTH